MKNKIKIRIIKDKANNDSYTFLNKSEPPSVLQSNKYLDEIEIMKKPRQKIWMKYTRRKRC